MADGAWNESFVLHVDDDGERELVAFASGPAGVAEIELAPGTYLSVDYASPSTLCSIRTTRAADPSLIAALVGDEVTSWVMSAPPSDRPRRLGVLEQRRRFTSDPDVQGPDAQMLGSAARLASLIDDTTRHEFARGVAALELADRSRSLPVPQHAIESLTSGAFARAIALMRDGLDALERAEAIGPQALERVAGLLELVPRDSPAVLRARELRREVLSVAHRTIAAAAARPSPAMAGATLDRMDAPAPMPIGHFKVRFDDTDAVGSWTRLLDTRTLELVALAPVGFDRGRATSDLLVSPMLDWSTLTPESSRSPLSPAGSADAIRAAVRLGRRAVQLEASRHRGAADAWRSCAHLWESLGDVRRTELARRKSSSRDRPPQPTLSERVALAIDAA